MVPPSTYVFPCREAGAEGFSGRSSAAAEPSAVTEGDGMRVGERKKWPRCVGAEPGYSILLICLTPGRKPAARLWTESRMSVSSWLSLSLSRTTVCTFQLLLHFLVCCKICSHSSLAFLAILEFWKYTPMFEENLKICEIGFLGLDWHTHWDSA